MNQGRVTLRNLNTTDPYMLRNNPEQKVAIWASTSRLPCQFRTEDRAIPHFSFNRRHHLGNVVGD